MNPDELITGMFAGSFVLFGYLICAVIVLVFMSPILIGMCCVFHKAGKPWWAALIPVYSNYVLAQIVWNKGELGLLTLIPTLGQIVSIKMTYDIFRCFGYDIAFSVVGTIFSYIMLPVIGLSGVAQYKGPTEVLQF